jgi:glycerol-3-phosphate dehydrogenase (NAD(P)+)
VELGKGRKLDEVIAGMHGMVAEGVLTTNAAVGLARQHGVEMPITEQVHALLRQGKPPREAIHELMTRPFTTEVKLY